MLTKKVVINASPFILLCKSGLIEILPELFAEIQMPESVAIEIISGNDIATRKLYDSEQEWLIRCVVNHAEEVRVWNLGDGETEVLSFVFANKSEYTALIDDRAARKCAEALKIKTLGTGGILVLAKKRGLIDSVSEGLEKLRAAGMYISDEIISLLKKQARE